MQANSRRWWGTGRHGVQQSMGSQSETQLSNWITTTNAVKVVSGPVLVLGGLISSFWFLWLGEGHLLLEGSPTVASLRTWSWSLYPLLGPGTVWLGWTADLSAVISSLGSYWPQGHLHERWGQRRKIDDTLSPVERSLLEPSNHLTW